MLLRVVVFFFALAALTCTGNAAIVGACSTQVDWLLDAIRSGATICQIGNDIDGEAKYDGSGESVSLAADGKTVAIGAGKNDASGVNSGHVRVFGLNGSNWTQLGQDIDGEAADDRSGSSVSLAADGKTLAIGAIYNDGNGDQSGHVRVLGWDGSNWAQLGQDIDGEAAFDESGSFNSVSLAADGKTLAIGAYGNDGNGTDSGHVRVFGWDGSNWTQLGQDIDGEAAADYSGNSVSLAADGKTVAIGTRLNDGNGDKSGHVRVFGWDGSNWAQLGQDIDGEAAGDFTGQSVSLAADGKTVVIGALFNDGNGKDSGHVRVFGWDGSNWAQMGKDIDGEAAGDRSGMSVSLAADGKTVAIGALLNQRNGERSGHVRVYNLGFNPVAELLSSQDSTIAVLQGDRLLYVAGFAAALVCSGLAILCVVGGIARQRPAFAKEYPHHELANKL